MNEKQRARINFMKERVVNTIPEMDLENARILTESFRETGGEPLAIQKAKFFRRQCQEKTNGAASFTLSGLSLATSVSPAATHRRKHFGLLRTF